MASYKGTIIIQLFRSKIKNYLRKCSTLPQYFFFHPTFSDRVEREKINGSFQVYNNFITEDEELLLVQEAEPAVKRLRYEADHWDAAIIGYRETEKKDWNSDNMKILQKVREVAFPAGQSMPLVHILDLKADGVIKPHVDSVKFCGSTIAGLSILSDAVMRLVREDNPAFIVDVFLPRRSLYVMTDASRYHYTHAVLAGDESKFGDAAVTKNRRLSIICRNEP